MRAQLERFSPIIAYVGALALAGGLVLYAITRQFDLKARIPLVVGLVFLLVFIMIKPEKAKEYLTGRVARYGSNAAIMSLAFIGILVLVNFMSDRYHRRFDLTESKQYSLAPQTVQILTDLKEPVKITAFFTPEDPYQQEARQHLEDLLKEYAYYTDKITYEFIDPDQNPSITRQYGITSYGTLVLERGDKRQDTFAADEQGLTSAILKVSRDEVKAVYFTTGHKEHDPTISRPDGYSQIKEALEKDNYRVETINLATITDTIPSDMDVLVVAGPQVPFVDEERAALERYLNDGGKALIMIDPGQADPLGEILSKWGLRLRDDLIIDPIGSFFGDVATPLVSNYRYSQITKDLGGLTTLFPRARSVEKLEEVPEGVGVTLLAETSKESWGETDLKAQRVRYDEGQDTKGPLTLAASAQNEETKARLVIFGNSEFVSNRILDSIRGFANGDLFLNAVNWLAEEEELISIRPKPPEQRQILLTPSQMRLVLYSSAIFLPLIVLVVGATVWWQRR